MEKIKLCYHSLQKLKKIKSSSIHYLKHELNSFFFGNEWHLHLSLKKINNGKVLSERERRVNLNNNMTNAKRN